MRAVVMLNHELTVEDIPVPEPGPGEVLVKTLACGICGSDLHALKHTEKLVEVSERSNGVFNMDLSRGIVMGHEFCFEVVDFGPNTDRSLKAGTRAVSMPVLIRPDRCRDGRLLKRQPRWLRGVYAPERKAVA